MKIIQLVSGLLICVKQIWTGSNLKGDVIQKQKELVGCLTSSLCGYPVYILLRHGWRNKSYQEMWYSQFSKN
jgi:hypothetical protein